MTALDRLNRVRQAKFEYRRLLMKVEELETLASRMVPVLSHTSEIHSTGKTREDTWAALVDYKAECEDKLKDYLLQCRKLEEEIDECIVSPRIRAAMKGKYVDGLTAPAIAEAMNYHERQIYRFLKTGEKLYCERYKDERD